MTAGAGKNLQDIYDGTARQLAAIEGSASSALKKTAEAALNTDQNQGGPFKNTIEEQSASKESDLRSFKDKSIERLQQMLGQEIKETNNHLSRVTTELENLSIRLKEQIAALDDVYKENVKTACQNVGDQFEGAVDKGVSELVRHDFEATKHLRSHGTSAMNSLQQKLDHSLWESRSEEKLFNSMLFKMFMQKANSIDTHFSGLMQNLAAEFEKHYKALQARAALGDSEVKSEAQSILQRIEAEANQIEQNINEFFDQQFHDHTGFLDAHQIAVASDLSTIHDATTEKVGAETKELSASLVRASARDQGRSNRSMYRSERQSRAVGGRIEKQAGRAR